MKKEIYLPLVLIGLSAAFITVSFLVWLTRGNDSLLKKKLRIGAMILLLTGTAVGCSPEPSCYVPNPTDEIDIGNGIYPGGEIQLDLNISNVIAGTIMYPSSQVYTFQILDGEGGILDRGPIEAVDGKYNDNYEEFELSVREDMTSGNYILRFYTVSEEYLDTHEGRSFTWFHLDITGRR